MPQARAPWPRMGGDPCTDPTRMAAAGVDDGFTAARRDDALRTFSRALEARPPGSFAAAPKHEPLSYAHVPPWQANAGSVDLWLLYLECYASREHVPISEVRDLIVLPGCGGSSKAIINCYSNPFFRNW